MRLHLRLCCIMGMRINKSLNLKMSCTLVCCSLWLGEGPLPRPLCNGTASFTMCTCRARHLQLSRSHGEASWMETRSWPCNACCIEPSKPLISPWSRQLLRQLEGGAWSRMGQVRDFSSTTRQSLMWRRGAHRRLSGLHCSWPVFCMCQ